MPAPPPLRDGTTAVEPPEGTIEPEITITTKGTEIHEEYRANGRLYMVKVVPAKGKPYYLLYDQLGKVRRSDLGLPPSFRNGSSKVGNSRDRQGRRQGWRRQRPSARQLFPALLSAAVPDAALPPASMQSSIPSLMRAAKLSARAAFDWIVCGVGASGTSANAG